MCKFYLLLFFFLRSCLANCAGKLNVQAFVYKFCRCTVNVRSQFLNLQVGVSMGKTNNEEGERERGACSCLYIVRELDGEREGEAQNPCTRSEKE